MTASGITISEAHLASIKRQGEETYPHECCGLLVGRSSEAGRVVVEIAPVRNARGGEDRRNRYLIPPESYMHAERAAREKGLDIIGFYHSHPDVAAQPSAYDMEQAWPWYSYLIVSVKGGRADHWRCWRLQDDRSQFDEERIMVSSG